MDSPAPSYARHTRRLAFAAVFLAAVFLSASLLFLIQPMQAKRLLPILGGTPAVWTTCMLFFQVVLLAGYAWAHLIASGRSRAWLWLHGVVVLLGVAAVLASRGRAAVAMEHWPPTVWLLVELALSVGPGFFVLASAGPLLQRWYAKAGLPRSSDPYFLYAGSNAGSLLGLLGYPLLVEPAATLDRQAAWWAAGFVAAALLILACGASGLRGSRTLAAAGDPSAASGRPSTRTRLAWIGLAFVPSSLMLGATSYLSTDIAAFPLLWVVPLALYLCTFIVAFGVRRRLHDGPLARVVVVLLIATAATMLLRAKHPVLLIAALHLAMLFAGGLLCHARLSATRPAASRLTEFYLCVSIGGALGGLFNAIVAPLIFPVVAEYPITLALVALALPKPARVRRVWWTLPIAVAAYAVVLRFASGSLSEMMGGFFVVASVGIPLLIAYLASAKPVAMAGCLAASLLLISTADNASVRTDLVRRSFFGVHRVETVRPRDTSLPGHRRVLHGSTVHGTARLDDPTTPTSYYHARGPIGGVFRSLEHNGGLNIAAIGLGAGSIASYTEPGDRLTFIEIDPAVIEIATDPRLFRFVSDAEGLIEIVRGDGRIRLADIEPGSLDLLVVDAFSSDAIPVHLLTREAFELYLSRIAPSGMVALHVSNQYLDLVPVVAAIAAALDAPAFINYDDGDLTNPEMSLRSASVWVVLRRADATGRWNPVGWPPLPSEPTARGWTDQRSDILGVMRWDMPGGG